MGERRFAIAEIRNCHSQIPEITESEFKRRFSRAAEKYRCYDHPWESVLNVLLHGEGEKDDFPGPEDILKMREERKPSPTTTRAEWEAWFHESPFHHNPFTMKWFKSMPIVPKEDK